MKFNLVSFILSRLGSKRNKIVASVIFAGITNGMVMLVINDVAKDFNEINVRNLLFFALCIFGFMYARRYSEYNTQACIQSAISERHLTIIDKLRKSSLSQYEKIGKMSVISNLLDNSQIIYESTRILVHVSTAGVMLIFCFGYIAWLSTIAFWMCAVILTIGIFTYKRAQRQVVELYHQFQAKDAEFFNALNHFLDGFKELKISREKSNDIYINEFSANLHQSVELKLKSEKKVVTNTTFIQSLFYVLMASIVFLLPQLDEAEPSVLMSITAVVLFMSGAIGLLVEAMPLVMKADIALSNLDKMESRINQALECEQQNRPGYFNDFSSIRLSDLSYNYLDETKNKMFSIGPVDLTLNRGEIIFLVGGNGSGKTTLLKNLCGLYSPSSGSIHIDDRTLQHDSYDDFRNLFSIVLTDFHLFEKLYGLDKYEEKDVNDLLARMQIENKTHFKNGRFSSLDLSTGQRKRIALIVSLLEDKPIMVFDEVAADQDPEFREEYYRVILPELKKQNKTIILVSHDDRYFDMADTLIKLEYGKIASITRQEHK
ncbi:cyclic peptide export ABC transporter [Rheinheimera soli]|uniref:ATP-binding cassette transporter n=1 Tax=Rheinheimera soli TaxID=443616 RepID=A0ABU1VVH3_9GAMM|nr:cyclic peptide export ABC transporter [Rheinheimera soli]MDR7119697.1 putative ATP-binding cassette transporter [Rheinheimera soli]